jgi:hypothetical protein
MAENRNSPWRAFFGCGGIALLFLTVLLLGITLACIATVAVPLTNKEIMQEIACPLGTTLVTGWEETTYTRPGEKVFYGYCEDAEGNQVQTQDLGYGALEYFPKYFMYSLAASFVLTLLVVIPIIIIFQVVKRKFFSKPAPPPSAIGGI